MEMEFAVFTLILSLESTSEKEIPRTSCPATERTAFEKSKDPPAAGPAFPLACYFILIYSEGTKADRFPAPPPCVQWDHAPPVTGKHTPHRQHPWVLLLPEHPAVQSALFSTNPENSRAAITHLGMPFNLLAHGLGWLSPPRRGWQGTDLLAVLELT